jgi:hypothetical protein
MSVKQRHSPPHPERENGIAQSVEPELIDPVDDVRSIRSGDSRASHHSGVSHHSEPEKELLVMPAWKKFLFSKWGCAVLLSTFTIIVIVLIRPSFILKRRENIMARPRLNGWVVFITWIAMAAAIVIIPTIIVLCRKKWVQK